MKMIENANRVIPKTPSARNPFPTDALRWQAVQSRNPAADSAFVYSVESTGIFCRPTCPSKLAARRQVEFHENVQAAVRAGYRPCKRCHPEGISPKAEQAKRVAAACRLIENSEAPSASADLAQKVGLSRHHFQRIFKAHLGVTPGEYSSALKSKRARGALQTENPVTGAIYTAGYGSSSRFYERSNERLGMTASDFRAGANGIVIQHAIQDTSLGLVLVAGTALGICLVRFGATRNELETGLRHEFPKAILEKAGAKFRQWVSAVVKRIEKPARDPSLPLDIRGTAFQMRVWQALREIPTGETASYAEVAKTIGRPKAVRAVATACASNKIAILVPCHRVIRTDGGLGGYRWGLKRKQELLNRERSAS